MLVLKHNISRETWISFLPRTHKMSMRVPILQGEIVISSVVALKWRSLARRHLKFHTQKPSSKFSIHRLHRSRLLAMSAPPVLCSIARMSPRIRYPFRWVYFCPFWCFDEDRVWVMCVYWKMPSSELDRRSKPQCGGKGGRSRKVAFILFIYFSNRSAGIRKWWSGLLATSLWFGTRDSSSMRRLWVCFWSRYGCSGFSPLRFYCHDPETRFWLWPIFSQLASTTGVHWRPLREPALWNLWKEPFA